MKVLWSETADEDLMGISEYTVLYHSRSQAIKYISKLELHLQRVARRPSLDRPHPPRERGIFRTKFQRHAIFFQRLDEGTIFIIRVLGERMDFDRHL